MCNIKSGAAAWFLTFLLTVSGQAFSGETFKSSKFLAYPHKSQQGYISTASQMAGVIAAQNNAKQANCIDDWVSKYKKDGYRPIIKAMQKYPDYHPMGIILGVLQKACGSFKYKD